MCSLLFWGLRVLAAIQVLVLHLVLPLPTPREFMVFPRFLFPLLVWPPTSSKDLYGLLPVDVNNSWQVPCCKQRTIGSSFILLSTQITGSSHPMVHSEDRTRLQLAFPLSTFLPPVGAHGQVASLHRESNGGWLVLLFCWGKKNKEK